MISSDLLFYSLIIIFLNLIYLTIIYFSKIKLLDNEILLKKDLIKYLDRYDAIKINEHLYKYKRLHIEIIDLEHISKFGASKLLQQIHSKTRFLTYSAPNKKYKYYKNKKNPLVKVLIWFPTKTNYTFVIRKDNFRDKFLSKLGFINKLKTNNSDNFSINTKKKIRNDNYFDSTKLFSISNIFNKLSLTIFGDSNKIFLLIKDIEKLLSTNLDEVSNELIKLEDYGIQNIEKRQNNTKYTIQDSRVNLKYFLYLNFLAILYIWHQTNKVYVLGNHLSLILSSIGFGLLIFLIFTILGIIFNKYKVFFRNFSLYLFDLGVIIYFLYLSLLFINYKFDPQTPKVENYKIEKVYYKRHKGENNKKTYIIRVEKDNLYRDDKVSSTEYYKCKDKKFINYLTSSGKLGYFWYKVINCTD